MRANAWTVLAVTTVLPVLVRVYRPRRARAHHRRAGGVQSRRRRAWTPPCGRYLATARLHRPRRRDARGAARPPRRPAAGRRRPAALVRPDHRAQRRQHVRRLPLADQRLRRHAADRHRHRQQRIVGPGRRGPRNQRRTPMAINTAFYPTLMWNSRFRALSGDPFDNSAGFAVPAARGAHALVPAAPAHGAGVHPAHRARRGGGVRTSRATTTTSAPRCCGA